MYYNYTRSYLICIMAATTDPYTLPKDAAEFRYWYYKGYAFNYLTEVQRQLNEAIGEGVPEEDAIAVAPIPKGAWRMVADGKYNGCWVDGYAAVRPFFPTPYVKAEELQLSLKEAIERRREKDASERLERLAAKPIRKIVDRKRGMEYTVRAASEKDKEDFAAMPELAEAQMKEVKRQLGVVEGDVTKA